MHSAFLCPTESLAWFFYPPLAIVCLFVCFRAVRGGDDDGVVAGVQWNVTSYPSDPSFWQIKPHLG